MNADPSLSFHKDGKLKTERPREGFIDPVFVRRQDPRFESRTDAEIEAHFFSPDYAAAIVAGKRAIWPNALFDPNYYVDINPDVLGHNPVVHFVRIGHTEVRPWNPLFDASHVRSRLNIKSESILDLIRIFIEASTKRPVSGHPLIDPDHIASQTGCDPLTAYFDVVTGNLPAELDPHRLFASRYYMARTGLQFASMREMLHDYIANWSLRPAPIYLFDRAQAPIQVFACDGGHGSRGIRQSEVEATQGLPACRCSTGKAKTLEKARGQLG